MKKKVELLIVVTFLLIMSFGVILVEASGNPSYSEDLCVDPSKASESSSYSGRTAARAFDNSNTFYQTDAFQSASGMQAGQWISYDFEVPQKIQKYTITPAPIQIKNICTDWEFQGSNDGEIWTTLDKIEDYYDWPEATTREFYINNNQSFRYYRLYATELNVGNNAFFNVGEMEMMKILSNQDEGNNQSSFNTNLYILLTKQETVNLTAFLLGTSSQQNLVWSSGTTATAIVDNNGTVTAIEAGTTVITVRTEDGQFVASCKIKVIDDILPPTENGALRLMVLLEVGETFRLELEGNEELMVTWISADESIAIVDTWLNQNRRGEVTAIAEGTTYITASDGIQSEIIYVRVE